MKPIQVDVFFPIPEGWGMCTSCELIMSQAGLGGSPQERGLDEYPPEWQADLRKLSSAIFELSERFPYEVHIRIWDPRSFQGLLRSIRHGIRRYPTFIVEGQSKHTGWDTSQLVQDIQSRTESSKSAI